MTDSVGAPTELRRELLAGALGGCFVLAVLGLLFLAAVRNMRPGTDAWTTVTVENASKERVLVTPIGDRENRYRKEWGRGMLMFEGTSPQPPMRVKRFEVEPGATWTMRFDPGVSFLEGVVVEGIDGRARMIRAAAPATMWEKKSVRVDDVASIAEATPEERAVYAAIPELRAREWRVMEVAAVLPALNLPWVWWVWWVWWMWWRAGRRGRAVPAPSPSGL